LPDTSPVWISEEQIINELTWVHITHVFGRSGWVLRDNLTF
jgi:hypothetical protein